MLAATELLCCWSYLDSENYLRFNARHHNELVFIGIVNLFLNSAIFRVENFFFAFDLFSVVYSEDGADNSLEPIDTCALGSPSPTLDYKECAAASSSSERAVLSLRVSPRATAEGLYRAVCPVLEEHSFDD